MRYLRKPNRSDENWAVQLQREMNNLFERFFQEPFGRSNSLLEPTLTFTPALNVRESETNYIVEAEVPGMDVKDLEVEINDRVLTIRGEKRDERTSEEGETFLTERQYGSFKRSFTLPENALADEVKAYTKNGVLFIEIPKEKPKDVRKIDIDNRE